MTLYRSDWKPSDVAWDSWYWAKWRANGVLFVLHVTEWDEVYDDRGNLYKIDDLAGLVQLGPRIDPPRENPVSGVCCSCGNDDTEESPCPKREDGTHCEHWWDGPEIEYRCSNCGEPCNESGCSRLPSCAGQQPRRIDDPADDAAPTQEIRIPVAQRGNDFAWWGNSSQGEVENRDMALDTLGHDFGPGPFDRVFTARIPIPAPQPDIEVEAEVEVE